MTTTANKTITLNEAFQILESASAVVVSDNAVTYPGGLELTGEHDNQFLTVSWDEDGEVEHTFLEGANQTVVLAGMSLFLVDREGEEIQITPLFPRSLEVESV